MWVSNPRAFRVSWRTIHKQLTSLIGHIAQWQVLVVLTNAECKGRTHNAAGGEVWGYKVLASTPPFHLPTKHSSLCPFLPAASVLMALFLLSGFVYMGLSQEKASIHQSEADVWWKLCSASRSSHDSGYSNKPGQASDSLNTDNHQEKGQKPDRD